MNYIAEMRAFYEWVPYNPIPADAQALWHVLMHVNNKCAVQINGEWYWRVEFKVPNSTLVSILNFSDVQLGRMRSKLIQVGRIRYKSGKGNQAGKYTILPFDQQYVGQTVAQIDAQSVAQTDGQMDINLWYKPLPLIINNNLVMGNGSNNSHCLGYPRAGEAAEAERLASSMIFKHFMRKPFPVEVEYLVNQLSVCNREPELVEEALRIACAAGQPNLQYLKGVFVNFGKNGIKTADDYFTHEAQRDFEV